MVEVMVDFLCTAKSHNQFVERKIFLSNLYDLRRDVEQCEAVQSPLALENIEQDPSVQLEGNLSQQPVWTCHETIELKFLFGNSAVTALKFLHVRHH